jgi:malto-oligosyltrehalose trehalohydrolase
MKCMHAMPFGAEVVDGGALFRLWAPERRAVAVVVGREAPRETAMRERDGWHEAFVEGVSAGTAYAFRVDEGDPVADPASRSNPWGVNAASAIVDPRAFEWDDASWKGRPWREAVVYELHVGAFTAEGTFAAAAGKLDHLADAGITAIELMPVAAFAGRRNWGYDGVLPFAPAAAYGAPDDFKRFVAAAHARGLMVLLDVVYNHFGPEGNHLARYAPQFFDASRHTPWGSALNFDGPSSRTVRDFFMHNALYWIEEFRLDGLRLDAVHAIEDCSPTHIVDAIARSIGAGPGREREVHVVLENDANEARRLRGARGEAGASAQWNDDWHHAAHVLVAGERDGYYRDYAERPAWHLARALAEGFSYQGESSKHRGGNPRGERSAEFPFEAFVAFLQNHDQVGNRALGERLGTFAAPERLRLAEAVLLLAPSVPMVFMGEEFGATTPFLYFCDFDGDLGRAVREGRRGEFAAFERFGGATESIPDPNAEETFLASKLDWSQAREPGHRETLARFSALLALRREHIVPRLEGAGRATFEADSTGALAVDWTLGDGSRLHLRANFSDANVPAGPAPGAVLHATGAHANASTLEPWSAQWTIEPA